MKTFFFYFNSVLLVLFVCGISSCKLSRNELTVQHIGTDRTAIHVHSSRKYLLLPIEEKAKESKMEIACENKEAKTIAVHLAVNKVDYMVPLDLSEYDGKKVTMNVQHPADSALCWEMMKLSDAYDRSNREYFRPVYHHSPLYGWMNDPNGMVYLNGVYHLFYQYNPYDSMWGNMHWGHAVSKDLVHWKELPVALVPDKLGTIYSGSCVIDKENTAGFGKNAMVAFYTSAGERQAQSIAYSLDEGRTFTKYEKNPVLTSENPDFRDPKVFWHEGSHKWIMVLAVGPEIQIFSSSNIKEWTFESSFGKDQGAHGGVWECPDLFELPVDGDTHKMKWVMLCNFFPGGVSGGSATQYFVGNFDGKTFTNDSKPEMVKWMDWGKDHYATVTWSNAPGGRRIALAWMSNWEYANKVPTLQYRSANSIPRDLSLFTRDNEVYLASTPSAEMLALRKEMKDVSEFEVEDTYNMGSLLQNNKGAYELLIDLKDISSEVLGFKLFNGKGESVDFCLNEKKRRFSIDRTKSGMTDFSNEFPAITSVPIENSRDFSLRIFVDKTSIECFGKDGKFAMTNLVFPGEPYDSISFYTQGGSYKVSSFIVYKLNNKE